MNPIERLRPYEEIADRLSLGSIPLRYEPTNFKSLLFQMISKIGPAIAKATVEASSQTRVKSAETLWEIAKDKPLVRESFDQLINQFDRMAVIFLRSKFENNSLIGADLMKASLLAERNFLQSKDLGKDSPSIDELLSTLTLEGE